MKEYPGLGHHEEWWRVDFIRDGDFRFKKFPSHGKAKAWLDEQELKEGFCFLYMTKTTGSLVGER